MVSDSRCPSIQNRPNTFTHLSIPTSFRFTRLPRCSYVRLRRMKCKCTSANIACFPGFHLSWQVFSVSDRKIPVMTGFLRNLPAIFTLLWSLPTGTYSRDEIIIDSSESVWFGLRIRFSSFLSGVLVRSDPLYRTWTNYCNQPEHENGDFGQIPWTYLVISALPGQVQMNLLPLPR